MAAALISDSYIRLHDALTLTAGRRRLASTMHTKNSKGKHL